jgi:hypothetical protein
MQVVFDHPLFYVIDYAGQDALEILDKRTGRMALVRGAVAVRMRDEFHRFLAQEHDEEEVADFIDAYGAVLDQPVTHH